MYDNSQLTTYQSCPMKYYLRYILGLEKKDVDIANVDLSFGSYTHTFLEEWYKWRKDKTYKPKTIEQIWSDYPIFPGETTKIKQAGEFLCDKYVKQYANIEDEFEILDIEYCLEFKLGDYPFTVKVDTVVRHRDQIYGLEHKTTGALNYYYFNRYFINSQISAQTYAIKQKYGECSGIIVNALEIKNLKRKSKDREAGLNASFARQIMNRTTQEIEDWRTNAIELCHRITIDIKNNSFPKSDGNGTCTMFKGCTYKELCKSSIGMYIDEQIKETLYQPKDDPLDYLKTGS